MRLYIPSVLPNCTMFVFCPALGELNESKVAIPLEGDEIVPVSCF